ncbi:DUF3368 domain-containing protein [Thiohalorhabdus methylotrophus]|uniref:DUF3368 domain-containing protein n=1 Tax=Thiohalorhabdus methylotrophus TaxID=3242694 RepID=A0ABV4TYY6_9GAMM
MSRAVIADAGPLIALAKLEHLDLPTALFTEVLVPTAVAEECTRPTERADAWAIGAALDHDSSYRRVALEGSRRLSAMGRLLDTGEAQALVLALNSRLPVLMDERRGRLEARRLGVEVIGTGAVLVAAKHKGLVNEVGPLLDSLTQNGYRLSESLRQALLEKSGELN